MLATFLNPLNSISASRGLAVDNTSEKKDVLHLELRTVQWYILMRMYHVAAVARIQAMGSVDTLA